MCRNLATLLLRRTQREVLYQLANGWGCRMVHVTATKSYLLVSKFQSRVAAVHNRDLHERLHTCAICVGRVFNGS